MNTNKVSKKSTRSKGQAPMTTTKKGQAPMTTHDVSEVTLSPEGETAMTTHSTPKKTTHPEAATNVVAAVHASAPATSALQPDAPVSPPPAVSPPTPVPAPVLVKPPPATANIPSVPAGAPTTNATDYRGITPKKSELAVLGEVVSELKSSTEYAALFGKTMPSLAFTIQVFDAANQWSLMRNKTDAWDAYSRTMEGLMWLSARGLMTNMKPVFEQVASVNADVGTLFPSLGLLLGAQKAIAQRAATTRKANAKLEANGQAPTKGKVGKTRKRRAEVAAYAATQATGTHEAASPTPVPAAAPPQVPPTVTAPAANGVQHS
jgi:hypothetical protein